MADSHADRTDGVSRSETERVARVDEKPKASSNFGALLRSHRLAAGFSQETLAERARMSVNGISALERGERRAPQRQTVALLASALELDLEAREAFEAAARRPSVPRPASGRIIPGLRPEVVRSNVPPRLTSFIGRESECGEIASLARERRMVTLTGSGGVGKTRCALESCATLEADFVDGAWLVELAPLDDPGLVPSAIGAAIGVRESPACPMLDTLAEYLKRKRLLLILDNCEHVIDAAARVAQSLLLAAPNVHVIATSREPLRISGEQIYRVPSLGVPELGVNGFVDPVDVASTASIALFVDRARSADHRFTLTEANASLVVRICRRLDGIALAIELAAARARTMPLDQLAGQLEVRLDVLSSGLRTALPRQQTMSGAIAWSYDLLGEQEQRVFERLSSFAGSFAASDAVAVCRGIGIDDVECIEIVASLAEKSLLVCDAHADETRYRFLESTRQFASGRLEARGESTQTARQHARHMAELGRSLREALETSMTQREKQRFTQLYLADFRRALEWALADSNDIELGSMIAAAAGWVFIDDHQVEGRRWVRLASARYDSVKLPEVGAHLALAEGILANSAYDEEAAIAAAERAARAFDAVGDAWLAARARWVLGVVLPRHGRHAEAEPYLRDALERARSSGKTRFVGTTLHAIGSLQLYAKDFDRAIETLTEAERTFEALGDELRVSITRSVLADVEYNRGDLETAIDHGNEAIEVLRRAGDRTALLTVLANQTERLAKSGRLAQARDCVREAIVVAADVRMTAISLVAVQHLITALARGGSRDERRSAARLFGFFIARFGERGPVWYEREFEAGLAAVRAELPAHEFEHAMADGAKLSEDRAFDEALLL